MTSDAATYARLLTEHFPQGGTWSEKAIKAVLERPGGHIFENTGGFVITQAVLDEAEIWALLVQPKFRRQGYAKDLIKTAIDALLKTGVKTLFLEVAADNEAAIALYLDVGFTQSGRRKAYYRAQSGAPVDALVMRCAL